MSRHAGVRSNRGKGVRIAEGDAEAVWSKFLDRLTTMSPIEISKLEGMPSAPAFGKKRKRDKEFDARATAVMASRRLNNGGRRKIDEWQWSAFLAALPHSSMSQICDTPDMPSLSVVFKRRRTDMEFRKKLAEAHAAYIRDLYRRRSVSLAKRRQDPGFIERTPSGRPHQESFRAALMSDHLYAAADAVVPRHIDPTDRGDIIADLVVGLLEGEFEVGDLAKWAKEYTRRHNRLFSKLRHLSLDAPVRGDGTRTLLETISNDTPHF